MELARLAGVNVKVATTRYETARSAFSRYRKNNKAISGSGRDNIVIEARWEHLRWPVPFIKYRESATSNTKWRQKPPGVGDIRRNNYC